MNLEEQIRIFRGSVKGFDLSLLSIADLFYKKRLSCKMRSGSGLFAR
jgi:hypothetical protein